MRLLLTWTRRVVMLMVLAGTAGVAGPGMVLAEATLSSSNGASGGLGGQMLALLGQERAAMGALDAGRLEQIVTAPARAAPKPVAVAAAAANAAPAAKAMADQVADAAVQIATAETRPVVVVAEEPATQPTMQPNTQPKPESFWALLRAQPRQAEPAPVQLQYSAAWLAGLPAARGDANWECLAKALYFEARGESVAGQFAVGEVVLNRVDSGLYPRSICGVVNQGSRYACQFSFVCDGFSDVIRERGIYQQVGKIAELLIEGAPRALTNGATHFRTGAVRPKWSRMFPQTAKIGSHYFHRQPMRLASN